MRSSTIWWGRSDGCSSPSRMLRMCTTLLSMRIIGGWPGRSWLGLQTGSKQNNQASRTEWCGCTRHTVSRNTSHKGTSGFDQTGWQKSRRPNIDTVARRQTFDLGRHRGELWAHRQLHICRLLLGLPAPQQTSLPVVKRRNMRALPTRIFFSQSHWNPMVRSVQVPSPSSPLWTNAWRVPPATSARCHIYSKDSLSLYSVWIRSLYTRALFLPMKNRTSSHSNFRF